jgi:hypothetical protein
MLSAPSVMVLLSPAVSAGVRQEPNCQPGNQLVGAEGRRVRESSAGDAVDELARDLGRRSRTSLPAITVSVLPTTVLLTR